MSNNAATCYRADPQDGFSRVALDGLTALYHRRSGTTHIVAEPVPTILALLAAEPMTSDVLLSQLGARFDLQVEGDTLAAIEAQLAELEAEGLVFRA